MTDLAWSAPPPDPARPEREPRKCRRHVWCGGDSSFDRTVCGLDDYMHTYCNCGQPIDGTCGTRHVRRCVRCGQPRNPALTRRNRNNRARGGRAELDVARAVGGQKVGPLGLPWDVTMPGYARLQVRKYLRPESLTKIAAELARIGSGSEMPGYVWIQPGRGGEQLIVFRLRDFAERHGVEVEGERDG